MAEQDDNKDAGPGPGQKLEMQDGLASLQESVTMPMTPQSDAMTFDSNTVRREIDSMTRQLDGLTKRLGRLGRAF